MRLLSTLPLLLLLACPNTSTAGIGPRLAARLADAAPDAPVAVILRLAHTSPGAAVQPNLGPATARARRAARSWEQAAPQLEAVLGRDAVAGARRLWIVDGLATQVPASSVAALAALPAVAEVILDAPVQLQRPTLAADCSTTPGWNIAAVGAPTAWANGYTGQGRVVAVIDGGVDSTHPDLAGGWRGGTNSWFDAFDELDAPADTDSSAHGTGVTGVAVGANTGTFAIGVAPGAQWIAARAFRDTANGSESTLSQLLATLQWTLDPDGDPATDDAPDVVNGSWTFNNPGEFAASPGGYAFREALQILRDAGVLPVFAAGNNASGGSAGTSESPANYPETVAVGSVGDDGAVPLSSARGPSALDGAALYPDLVAPGACITTADEDLGAGDPYALRAGTSFASPHVAGAAALLESADPTLGVEELELELKSATTFLAGQTAADNATGHGELALSASPLVQPLPAGALSGVSLATDADGTEVPGDTVTFTATPADTGSFEYRFWLAGPASRGAWTLQRGYATDPTWAWDTTAADSGSSRLAVQARVAGSALAYEASAEAVATLPDAALAVGLSADPAELQVVGGAVVFTAAGAAGSGHYQYRFLLQGPGTGDTLVELRPFSSEPTWAWQTSDVDLGESQVVVELRGEGSKAEAEATTQAIYAVVAVEAAAAAAGLGLDLPERGLCFVSTLGFPKRASGAWLPMLVLLLGGLLAGCWRATARRPAGGRFFFALLASAALSLAFPGSARAASPEPRWDVQFSAGALWPQEDTWGDHYDQNVVPDGRLGLGYRLVGGLEIGIEAGYRRADGSQTVTLGEETATTVDLDLTVVPLGGFVLYQWRAGPRQLLVPYVSVGIGPTYYKQVVKGGDTTRGSLWGYRAGAGCKLALGRFDPGAARKSRINAGVQHTYLLLEVQYSRIDDFGRNATDLGGVGVYGGLALEF